MQQKRGIDPVILLGLVENTASFFLENTRGLPYLETLRAARAKLREQPGARFTHQEYFELCLAAHYGTVATFVPTDVDNQIRKHLWETEPAITRTMAELTLRSRGWEFRPVTARYVEGAGAYLSGHQGEWFSVAVGAYAAHRASDPALAGEVLAEIERELRQESQIFEALKKARNGVELLRASTLIAHNLGDLDRVIDQWELPKEDALRLAVYKLGHEPHASFGPAQTALLEAGALNKAFMASENHRHYPLRKPKCLRRAAEFMLPLGPFFDAWGETVARSPLLDSREKAEVVEALLDGFHRLSSPKVPLYGYARALAGLQRAFPGGPKRLLEELPSKSAKSLSKGEIPEIQRPSAEQFNGAWAKKSLNFLKLS